MAEEISLYTRPRNQTITDSSRLFLRFLHFDLCIVPTLSRMLDEIGIWDFGRWDGCGGGGAMIPRYTRYVDKTKPAIIIKFEAILANFLIYLLTK